MYISLLLFIYWSQFYFLWEALLVLHPVILWGSLNPRAAICCRRAADGGHLVTPSMAANSFTCPSSCYYHFLQTWSLWRPVFSKHSLLWPSEITKTTNQQQQKKSKPNLKTIYYRLWQVYGTNAWKPQVMKTVPKLETTALPVQGLTSGL